MIICWKGIDFAGRCTQSGTPKAWRTDGRTDGQPRNIMSRRSHRAGHKNIFIIHIKLHVYWGRDHEQSSNKLQLDSILTFSHFYLLPWRVVGPSVHPSTPLTRQPMFGFFSKLVGIFLGWISLDDLFFKSSISQYLFRIFSSILAFIFLRVVVMSYKEVCARKFLGGYKINMGSNGKNLKVHFLKNCSVTFFLFFHEASLGWHNILKWGFGWITRRVVFWRSKFLVC